MGPYTAKQICKRVLGTGSSIGNRDLAALIYKNLGKKRRPNKKESRNVIMNFALNADPSIIDEVKKKLEERFGDRKKKKVVKKTAKASRSDFYLSDEWRALRYQALKKYGRKCLCCGATPESGAILHVDHIFPRSKYPEMELDISNLQVLCEDCNLGKSNTDSVDYRPVVAKKPISKPKPLEVERKKLFLVKSGNA